MSTIGTCRSLSLCVLCAVALLSSAATPQYINVSQTPGPSQQPDLAATPDGDLHIVWADHTGGMGQILHKKWSSGMWSGVFPVSDPAFDAQEPSIAVDPDGPMFLVAWEEDHGGVLKVWAAISDGVIWDRFPIAPEEPGPQRDPDAFVRSDGSMFVSWWDEDSTIHVSQVWGGQWSPIVVDICFPREGNRLVEAGDDLAVVCTAVTPEDCMYELALWDGENWTGYEGETVSASGEMDAASAPGDVVHFASLPGILPTCPCWHLTYASWDPAAGIWSTPEVLSETHGEYWLCLEPDLALDRHQSPVVAYTYEELDGGFNRVRKDVVLARRDDDRATWSHEYVGLALENDPEDPALDFLCHFPAVAWSGNLESTREILLWAPLSDVEAPTTILVPRLDVWPNPSSGSIHLRVSGDVGATTDVLITDVAGRQLRRLRFAGDRPIIWDGHDARGRPLASGIYYASLVGPGISETARLIRIR